jgi:hypothetical protein
MDLASGSGARSESPVRGVFVASIGPDGWTLRASRPRLADMTIRRMDIVGVVADDLAAAIASFVELG